MSVSLQLPLWAAWLVAGMTVAGALLTLIGALGLVQLRSFYERVHAPTLGATLGAVLILAASAIFFSILEERLVLRELVIGLFVTVTTPVTFMLLARAAAYRDRTEGNPDAPQDL